MIAPVRSRWVSWVLLAVLAGAVTAAVVLANVMAARAPARIDLTGAGEHELSPRSAALLAGLDGRYEIVLALDKRTADRRTLDYVRDVLEAFARTSERVGFTELDLGSSAGIEQADRVVEHLADEQAGALGERRGVVIGALDLLDDTAAYFDRASVGLESVRDAIPADAPGGANNRAYFEQRAAITRVAAGEVRELSAQIRPTLEQATLPGGLVDWNAPIEPLRAATAGLGEQLRTLADDVARFAETEAMPAGARDAARPWAKSLGERRDHVAVLADRLAHADRLGLIDAARAIHTGQTLLVIGPPERGVTAIDLEALLPNTAALAQAGVAPGVYVAQRAEQLVATAIGSLARPDRPIVVLMHAEGRAGVLDSAALMTEFKRRLATRGIDVVEWATAVDNDPPGTTSLDPAGRRPVVYVTLATDSSAASGGDPDQAGARRAERLGTAVAGLIARGKPVLISAAPSIFRTYGDEDPMNRALAPFGIELLSGTPVLSEATAAHGRRVLTEQAVAPSGKSQSPIAGAIKGLRMLLPWPIGIDTTATEGVTVETLITLDGASAWAESDWLTLWRTARNQREFLPDQPAFNEGVDARRDAWAVAVAGERARPREGGSSRVVVVGSNGWMLDPIAARRGELVEGRAPLAFPGNAELFEAAVLWLARQDELIAPSPEARPVALVKPLSEGQLATLRWVLIAGLPGAVLLGGVVHRVLRG
ncbi:MAG: hypothetical protein R3B49_05150 [Phycisphaerales bacterium]